MTRQAVHAVVDIPIHFGVIEVGRIVAAVTAGARKHRVVGRIGVTGCAHAICVSMVEREERVITARQGTGQPCGRGMASGAGGGPSSRCVIRIGRATVISGVARVAIGRRARKYIVDMALGAGD